jgi:hypothetical protein
VMDESSGWDACWGTPWWKTEKPKGEWDIYKAIFLTVIKPITPYSLEHIREVSARLKGENGGDSDNISFASGEVIERACRFIEMSLQLAKEGAFDA